MVTRRPLVVQDGYIAELPVGDTVTAGTSTTQVVAGSGLVGGGSVSTNPRVDLALAPNPSGVIYVGDALGIDGFDQVTSDAALASGSAAAVLADAALASGNSSLVTATAALASGNAALGLIPVPGPGGNFARFTAASAIASGYPVGVDDTGRVQSIRNEIFDFSNPMRFPDTATQFSSLTQPYIDTGYFFSFNRCIVAYPDQSNSNYGTVRIISFSGTSISVSSPFIFASSSVNAQLTVTIDTALSRAVICYQDVSTTSYPTAVIGYLTSGGASISFAGTTTIASINVGTIKSVYDSTNSKVVIAYDNLSTSRGTAIVGTVSSFAISFGTSVNFELGGNTSSIAMAFDSTNSKVVISYQDNTASNYGQSIIGTVSGTSISFGTMVVFNSSISLINSSVYDPINNRVVISYLDGGSGYVGKVIVGTVAGTSISFGSAVTITGAQDIVLSYDSFYRKIIAGYQSGSSGLSVVGTVSGTSISFSPNAATIGSFTDGLRSVYSTTSRRTVFAWKSGATGQGFVNAAQELQASGVAPTQNSLNNVLGISQSTVASGALCTISLPGTLYNNPTANLTPGSFYYVNPTTSGITTSTTQPAYWAGQVPWNYIGRAVSTSGLMLLKSI
jgi:hypothetical protein